MKQKHTKYTRINTNESMHSEMDSVRGDKNQTKTLVRKMQAAMVQTCDKDGCDMISDNTRCSNFMSDQKPTEASLV